MAIRKREDRIFKHPINRYPRLDTVLEVEDLLKKNREVKTVFQLWKSMKNKIMWQTFRTIIDYLVYSNKVFLDSENHVAWIWDPEGVERWKKKGVEWRGD